MSHRIGALDGASMAPDPHAIDSDDRAHPALFAIVYGASAVVACGALGFVASALLSS